MASSAHVAVGLIQKPLMSIACGSGVVIDLGFATLQLVDQPSGD